MLLLFFKLMFVLLAHRPGALGTPVTDSCVFGNWADPLPLPLFNNLADSSSHLLPTLRSNADIRSNTSVARQARLKLFYYVSRQF